MEGVGVGVDAELAAVAQEGVKAAARSPAAA